MIKKYIPIFLLGLISLLFYWQFFLKGFVPVPLDTIVGLYHPYRDFYRQDYPSGIPFKNFLITDPVRQQYPWKKLTIESFKNLKIPSWNPYSFSGTQNAANFQSGVFYPFNLILFLNPFINSWTLFVILQTFLASIFMYLFLRNLKLDEYSSFLGGLIFAFGGFFTTWLEWGTVLHTALWLPLILLSIDKIFHYPKDKSSKFSIFSFQFSKSIVWFAVLLFSSISSFFAGHLQIFFYLSVISIVYFIFRWFEYSRKSYFLFPFLIFIILFLILTAVQWIPTLNFLNLSARNLDVNYLTAEGWFIPWKHLIQLIFPDFFGNPTTLNYWGVWNYGELTAYASIAALILSIYALFFRHDKNTLFFGTPFFIALFFALPTFFAKLPYILNIPFLSTAQPTRLIFLIDFSLAVLSALGLNHLISAKNKKEIIAPILFVVFIMFICLLIVFSGDKLFIDPVSLSVAKRNMILPGLLFLAVSSLLLILIKVDKKFIKFVLCLLVILVIFDLFRFSYKFNTFSDSKYLYPETETIKYLKKNIGNQRISTTDPRILAPNFSVFHKIQSVEGYDPLYLSSYAELIAAINRNEPDINPPFGFKRIIRVDNLNSNLIDLLGVKYILSLEDLSAPGLKKVFQEGETRIYENTKVLPRSFFVGDVINVENENQAINLMFDEDYNPSETAVIEDSDLIKDIGMGNSKITEYSEDKIIIETDNKDKGFLVLTDSFYPTWKAKINGNDAKIYKTNYNFRGVIVPSGKNTIIFYNSLL